MLVRHSNRDDMLWILYPSLVGMRTLIGKPYFGGSNCPSYMTVRSVCACNLVDMSMLFQYLSAQCSDTYFAVVSAPARLSKLAKRATPSADRAPSFDADMVRSPASLWQRAQFVERPCTFAVRKAAHLEPVRTGVDFQYIVDVVERIEWKRLRDHRLRIGRRPLVRIEQQSLHVIVEESHPAQQGVHRLVTG